MINDMNKLLMGGDFEFGTMGPQTSKPRRTSTKKKKDPLWDII